MTLILDGTLGVSGVAGSASAPAVVGSDADSGYYINSANEPSASVNGTAVWNANSTFGFKNRIINGGMTIDQRNAGASVALSSSVVYSADRFQCRLGTSTSSTAQQSSTAPAGFTKSLLLTIGTGASPSAGTGTGYFAQTIEGFNWADLGWGTANAQPATLSFWVRSSLTGTFGVVVCNDSITRSYPTSYTISAANTWEYKTISIPATTSGTFSTDNTGSVRVMFDWGNGSDFKGTANTWANADYRGGATGTQSICATSGATWYITGVQLEKGSTATSFDFRDYGTELAMCQRYYYKIFPGSTNKTFGMGFAGGSTTAYAYIAFQTTMRTSPGALEQSGTASDYMIAYGGTSTNCNAVPAIINASQDGSNVVFSVASGLTTGDGVQARTSSGTGASAYLAWSAEL